MLELYSEVAVDRIIHEARAERESGKASGGLSEEEIEKIIHEAKGN